MLKSGSLSGKMTETASNSFSRKNKKKMLVFPKNAEKNASTIEKGLIGTLMMDVTAREELSKVHSPMMPAPFTKKKVRGGGRGVVVVVKVETEN